MYINDITGKEVITVAELIKELEKIEDKNAAVYMDGYDCFLGASNVMIESDGTVLIQAYDK